MSPASTRPEPAPEAVEFIRFCYRRRRAGWPELYDEMCAVASRGLFRGWSHEELAAHGIGFSLAGMPALAALVRETIRTEAAAATPTTQAGLVPVMEERAVATPSPDGSSPATLPAPAAGPEVLAGA
jgi:hypothetical protein